MKLSSLINPRLAVCGLAATTKDEALGRMVRTLVAAEPGLTEPEVMAALAEREKQGPFSMGKGIAFPHARTEKVKDFTVVFATVPGGVDFKAPDGVRVRIIILFVIPKKHSNLYLQTLAAFLNFFTVEQNVQRVLEAKTGEEAVAAIDALSSRPREVSGGPSAVPSVTSGSTLAKTIETILASKGDAVPVVDAEGNLAGEVTAGSILQFGVREHLLSLATPATLAGVGTVDQMIRHRGEATIESLGLVHANGFSTVQEEESTLDVTVRLAGSGGRGAYVLRGRKLVGHLSPLDLLRRITAKPEKGP